MVTRTLSLTGVYEPVEEGWIEARIEELHGVITAGRSVEEAKALLLDALREYLLALASPPARFDTREGAEREPLVIRLTTG